MLAVELLHVARLTPARNTEEALSPPPEDPPLNRFPTIPFLHFQIMGHLLSFSVFWDMLTFLGSPWVTYDIIGVGVRGSTWAGRRPSVPFSCTGSKLTLKSSSQIFIFFSRSPFTVGEVAEVEETSCIIHQAQSRLTARKTIF